MIEAVIHAVLVATVIYGVVVVMIDIWHLPRR